MAIARRVVPAGPARPAIAGLARTASAATASAREVRAPTTASAARAPTAGRAAATGAMAEAVDEAAQAAAATNDRAARNASAIPSNSVVDRGFEDVEEEAVEPRRVHWTIVKRTVADQITRKPVSQNYVLQREGNDSEFPTLGAARDTVKKKIVHPEKLTLSKARARRGQKQ